MDIQIRNPSYSYLALAVLAVMVLAAYAVWARSRAAKRFATLNLASSMLPPNRSTMHWMSSILVAIVLGLITLAVIDVRWGKTTREVPQKGLEVVFALDVSRSMLAEDVAPNRLQRAKQQITDMIDEMAGDRIGLVIFAGDAVQSVPLTNHYDDFRQILESVGPQSLNRGGSRLGEAIRVCADAFITKTNDHKAIVLFTDGEDQESEPIEAAQAAFADRGIRIFTIGLGDIEQGAVVPLSGEDRNGRPMPSYLRYQGEIVRTKLDGKILSQIATDTEGAYIPAGVQRVNMADVYHKYIASVGQAEFETAKAETYMPRFQWFAAPALLLLLIEVLITTRRSSPSSSSANRSLPTANVVGRAAVVLFAILGTSVSFAADIDSAQAINAANELVRGGKIEQALAKYAEVDAGSIQSDVLDYDLGVAKYLAGDLPAASDLFAIAAGSEDSGLAARSRFNLGNCCYAEAVSLVESDKPSAIKKLKEAIAHYRGSLVGDPDHTDARANIELAANLIRKLQEEQNSGDQQSQDPQQQQDQSQQSDDNPEADQQEKGEDQSASGDNQEPQKSEDGSSSEQKSGGQNAPNESDGDQQNESESESGSEEMNDSEGAGEPSPAEQDPAKDASQKGTPEPAPGESKSKAEAEEEPSQEPASDATEQESQSGKEGTAGELSAADESGEVGEAGEGDQAESTPEGKSPPRYLTREEAMKMLQAVRDRDMLRRLQQERAQQAQRFNVEKDW